MADRRPPVPLPARTDVAQLAWRSVERASAAGAALAGAENAPLDGQRIAVAYAGDRHLRLDGESIRGFAPLSGFFRTTDGWVRTHGNYPHHASALRRGIALSADADVDTVTTALAGMRAEDASRRIVAEGGICTPVYEEGPATDEALRDTPLLQVDRIGDAAPHARISGPTEAPLRGVRVLDLTRVIAGPVSTRTLALLGADVLRIDPPHLPEIELQHLDTGHGKRSALLDLRDVAHRTRFEELLATADVLVTGYRPAAMAALGLDPHAVATAHPGIVTARLSAWGEPDRRGFDSIVQAACGIAWIESADGERPGVLPAQALDHSAGYLLAAGIMEALAAQRAEGGSWRVETSLRRVAAELLGLPRTAASTPDLALDTAGHTQDFEIDGHRLTTAGPAVAYAGSPRWYAPPRPWGRDRAEWH
ncbi:CoA transferase [Microbacterium sp. ASV49]|uniref:CoA transferase n=1 Tax=Microbacterium candidum TaxID=3041922 RepID=A0ABT7N1P6_9MICO|nr:CoA transferase [Microbacterium sp. ASV49]MDL9980591.1 CoA transferase [Microbacterium sp. ASV49]